MAKLSALPNVAEGVNNGWLADKNDHIFLARRPQIPRVHKLFWKDDKPSRDWLKRISEINSGVFGLKTESANCPGELVNKQGGSATKDTFNKSTRAVEERSAKQTNRTDESYLSREPQSLDLQIPEGSQSRKPDSAYITSISRINVAFYFSEISKKSYSDETLTASLFQPKNGKFATQFLRVNDLISQGAFFPSEVSLQAKRKLSFEYIQDVSMLQYGHNSVENGNFRR